MSPKANIASKIQGPEDLRNVVLVGSSGSGKTTLFQNLLRARIPDYRPDKEDPERAGALALASVVNHHDTADGDVVINLLDAPGHPDFAGELRAGLRAADGAIFVISAADGIDPITTSLWAECASTGMPRAIVITKLDTDKADFTTTLDAITTAFGSGTHPAYLPLEDADGQVIGNMSLLTGHVHDYSSGNRVTTDADDEQRELIENFRTDYVESIITESEDDALLEHYFNGDELNNDQVVEALLSAMYHGNFFPVIPVRLDGIGTEEVLGFIHRGFPRPTRRTLPLIADLGDEPIDPPLGSPEGPLLAETIRTVADPYAGHLSMVRVYSGVLTPETVVHVAGHREALTGVRHGREDHDDTERVGLLTVPDGTGTSPTTRAVAGQIVYVAKLTKADTSDTLSDAEHPAVIEPWALPEPLLPTAIEAAGRNDEDKLASALGRLAIEDPTVRVERDPDTDQMILWTMGQAHRELVLTKLRERYGVSVNTPPVRVGLRETFIAKAEGHGRHVKQSGGHGQYAVCDIRVEPGERGSGFVFVDEVVGGAVPRQFIGSVEKGITAQLAKGTISGHPMVDIKVTLHDGKAHSVDSSDMAFQSAGALALREAAGPETVALLEPVDAVAVRCPNEYLGTVMTDLSNRRGQVNGTEPGDDGFTTVTARVPALELLDYAIDLRSIARGAASFTRSRDGFELMPAHKAAPYLEGN
ncbi:elongation factor G-like protein EF-G2 [Propionibacterium australiense]|uniref:Elongation factor G-like protein EF-G2 n=1 Tax=Propionibacterium australiense TaxID=119981 RepID=A0A383S7E9_9ACTN|nr:elongation factor G-like protein EF-G2 [Propionibacterium australiense]RLP07934.1 elongation factor G-like protein EF-G2 [Propionibacterium australiense]RLP08752.1 elongation factor G-like protein EF-G2 [Propionibacterium australiense]SYZ33334.1 Ribosomal protein S5 domain 2-type fold, subgroup [Propionibacterium australiense]VEH89763.1 Vegetative protein 19 [Propionibacterium australiense]